MKTTNKLQAIWKNANKAPFGPWFFSKILGFLVPYSGGIKPLVVKMEAGEAIIIIKEHRSIRNHLRSIHAIALANLAELAGGLAMLSNMPPNTRGIVKKFEIDFFKKARGQITATGYANPPKIITEKIEHRVSAKLCDTEGELVAEARILWQLGPEK
jgi:acyl-coenzyme A thioesterase PaaI-like protein